MYEDVATSFLAGGGTMGAFVRAYDWNGSALGAPATWSQSLRTAVRLLLNTEHPMLLLWGPQLTCLYNEAFRRLLGPDRHPPPPNRAGGVRRPVAVFGPRSNTFWPVRERGTGQPLPSCAARHTPLDLQPEPDRRQSAGGIAGCC